ncbi:hypothetical protein HPP92_022783 [Vanilla planifolia]|uniref:Uncharacterized protein n=1 Tax=Vanilla planifolia TaxID=51239 RepID=A0A835UG05_VANPL|nr:hypothetical protein HPP92_022783 [Vanilla planifolia]
MEEICRSCCLVHSCCSCCDCSTGIFSSHADLHLWKKSYILKTINFCNSFHDLLFCRYSFIQDIEGDRIFGIRSFSVRLGQKPVFWACVCLLEFAYAVGVVVGATSAHFWSKLVTVTSHAILASVLWNNARSVNLTNKSDITNFYMFIWKLFYAEYLLIPLIR